MIASSKFVQAQKINTALTGTPTAPTPATGTNTTQLATTAYANAIAGGTTIPAKSLASNGYVKLANGFIFQWGIVGSIGRTGTTVTFPIAFPNVCLNGQMSLIVANTNDWWSGSVGAVTTTTMAIYNHMDSGGIYWTAIGY